MKQSKKITTIFILTTVLLSMLLILPSNLSTIPNTDQNEDENQLLPNDYTITEDGTLITVDGATVLVRVDEETNTTTLVLDDKTIINFTITEDGLLLFINHTISIEFIKDENLTIISYYDEVSRNPVGNISIYVSEFFIDVYIRANYHSDILISMDLVYGIIYWFIVGVLTIWINIYTYEFYVWEYWDYFGYGIYLDFNYLADHVWSADIYFLGATPQYDPETIGAIPPETNDNLTATLDKSEDPLFPPSGNITRVDGMTDFVPFFSYVPIAVPYNGYINTFLQVSWDGNGFTITWWDWDIFPSPIIEIFFYPCDKIVIEYYDKTIIFYFETWEIFISWYWVSMWIDLYSLTPLIEIIYYDVIIYITYYEVITIKILVSYWCEILILYEIIIHIFIIFNFYNWIVKIQLNLFILPIIVWIWYIPLPWVIMIPVPTHDPFIPHCLNIDIYDEFYSSTHFTLEYKVTDQYGDPVSGAVVWVEVDDQAYLASEDILGNGIYTVNITDTFSTSEIVVVNASHPLYPYAELTYTLYVDPEALKQPGPPIGISIIFIAIGSIGAIAVISVFLIKKRQEIKIN